MAKIKVKAVQKKARKEPIKPKGGDGGLLTAKVIAALKKERSKK